MLCNRCANPVLIGRRRSQVQALVLGKMPPRKRPANSPSTWIPSWKMRRASRDPPSYATTVAGGPQHPPWAKVYTEALVTLLRRFSARLTSQKLVINLCKDRFARNRYRAGLKLIFQLDLLLEDPSGCDTTSFVKR